jgi:hypothetical protein
VHSPGYKTGFHASSKMAESQCFEFIESSNPVPFSVDSRLYEGPEHVETLDARHLKGQRGEREASQTLRGINSFCIKNAAARNAAPATRMFGGHTAAAIWLRPP